MAYLNSKEFEKAINRSFPHTRSPELKAALEAIREYERKPSTENIQRVSKLLRRWRSTNPKEFAARGSAIESQLRAELKSEYARYGLTYGLGTDLGDAQPFLVNSASGLPAQAEIVSHLYYYHATNYTNLRSIKRAGLDPNFGGRGGASDQVKSAQFKKRSAGKVHATTSTHTASFYGLLHDEPSLFVRAYGGGLFPRGIPPDPADLGKMTIILRFPQNSVPRRAVQKDPDDPRNAWRIYSRVSPIHIEALTTEGWVPIAKLVELDAALGL
jgi:hypothetical protein